MRKTYGAGYPDTLPALLTWSERNATAPAVTDATMTLTWHALQDRVLRVAGGLRKAGIGAGASDVRVVRSGKKVSFPMPRHSAILNLGGPLADRDHIEDMPLSTLRVVALGVTHPPRSTQLRRQLLFQHAAGLDEEAAIDRFVRYLHVLVGWELLLQPAGDLCGDHCSASFCATRHRSALYSAKRQGLGRNARSLARRSARFAR